MNEATFTWGDYTVQLATSDPKPTQEYAKWHYTVYLNGTDKPIVNSRPGGGFIERAIRDAIEDIQALSKPEATIPA